MPSCGRPLATQFYVLSNLPRCRWGALRGRRSLRDLYSPSDGAPVGRDQIFCADQREG
jgi:hypothetical protein